MRIGTVVAHGFGLLTLIVTGAWDGAIQARAGASDRAVAEFKQRTGMVEVEVPGTDGLYLGKTHRGYSLLFTAKAGNVWGRYAARLAMGEIGREVGGVLAYLTGGESGQHGAAGSALDRLLAEAIGQPISLTFILRHAKPGAAPLDIYHESAAIRPEVELPEAAKVGRAAGQIRSHDRALAARLAADPALIGRLRKLRGQYIRVDADAVSLFWAGQETDLSAMIRDHGGYWEMIGAVLDDLADIADALPPPDPPLASGD